MKFFITLILTCNLLFSPVTEVAELNPDSFIYQNSISKISETGTAHELTDVEKAYVVHAGGEIKGYTYTNCREAVQSSYDKGYRLIELDVEFTSDGKPVIFHGWDGYVKVFFDEEPFVTYTEEEFKNFNMINGWHQMTWDDLIYGMCVSWPEMYVVLDCKEEHNQVLMELIKEKYPFMMDRIVVQVFERDEYRYAKYLGFDKVIYTLYMTNDEDADIIEFCKHNHPFAVTMHRQWMYAGLPETLADMGIYTYVHTINTIDEYNVIKTHRYSGIYTDYLFDIDNLIEGSTGDIEMDKELAIGKLDTDLLEKLVFDNIIYKRDDVKSGAGVGADCAVVSFGEYDCITSTDPITASVSDVGRLAVNVSCNDIATNGVQPIAILLTVLLPKGTTDADVSEIMKQAAQAAADCNVEIVGGHTEITTAVNQPVICSTAFGKSVSGAEQSAKNMQVGDKIYVTKKLAMEGTGIIAAEYSSQILEQGILTKVEAEHAVSLLNDVSVVQEGVLAGGVGTHGMHDITEGGLLGAVWEMCDISGLGAKLNAASMPIDPVTQKMAEKLGFNPLRMISSGSMLVIVPQDKVEQMQLAMSKEKIPFTCVGTVTGAGSGVVLVDETGAPMLVTPPKADEIYAVRNRLGE